MQVGKVSETLTEKFERLVIHQSHRYLSDDHVKCIAEKFAEKSLNELHDMVGKLYAQHQCFNS